MGRTGRRDRGSASTRPTRLVTPPVRAGTTRATEQSQRCFVELVGRRPGSPAKVTPRGPGERHRLPWGPDEASRVGSPPGVSEASVPPRVGGWGSDTNRTSLTPPRTQKQGSSYRLT